MYAAGREREKRAKKKRGAFPARPAVLSWDPARKPASGAVLVACLISRPFHWTAV